MSEDCDPEDIFGAALWVDFNAASLRISLLDFSEYGCIRHETSDAILIGDIASSKVRLFWLPTVCQVNAKCIGWIQTIGGTPGNGF